MKERCVDASIAIKWAVKGEAFRNIARAFLADAGANGFRLIPQPLFISEVDSVIRRRVFENKMPPSEAKKAYKILDSAPVEIVDILDARQQARQIAEKYRQKTVYDATYAALAFLRDCEFWTADKLFYEAVQSGLRFVKYLPAFQKV